MKVNYNGPVARRSYDQYCPAARALDIVGDRWTLLIVRELLLGARRYSDLLEALRGMGTNLLAKRLRELEDEGLVLRRRLEPPAASTVYELTEEGAELERVLMALGGFGLRRLGRRRRRDRFRPEWLTLALRSRFDAQAAAGVRENYELRIDGQPVWIRVDDGSIETKGGPAADPDLVVEADASTLARLGAGELSPGEAAEAGAVRVDGDPATAERCMRILGVEAP
jgi:DNA-binding HxlR family transcriptional regulator/putative sterol carrier protein